MKEFDQYNLRGAVDHSLHTAIIERNRLNDVIDRCKKRIVAEHIKLVDAEVRGAFAEFNLSTKPDSSGGDGVEYNVTVDGEETRLHINARVCGIDINISTEHIDRAAQPKYEDMLLVAKAAVAAAIAFQDECDEKISLYLDGKEVPDRKLTALYDNRQIEVPAGDGCVRRAVEELLYVSSKLRRRLYVDRLFRRLPDGVNIATFLKEFTKFGGGDKTEELAAIDAEVRAGLLVEDGLTVEFCGVCVEEMGEADLGGVCNGNVKDSGQAVRDAKRLGWEMAERDGLWEATINRGGEGVLPQIEFMWGGMMHSIHQEGWCRTIKQEANDWKTVFNLVRGMASEDWKAFYARRVEDSKKQQENEDE